jgi:hypothetical protein
MSPGLTDGRRSDAWIAQYGKRLEFFHDWRFLFVGLRWWLAKIRGRA